MLDKGCRWEGVAAEALGSGKLIFYRGESDYQGTAEALVLRDDGRYAYLAWSWGSCSGCDPYEGMASDMGMSYEYGDSSKLALEDFRRSVQVMDTNTALQFFKNKGDDEAVALIGG